MRRRIRRWWLRLLRRESERGLVQEVRQMVMAAVFAQMVALLYEEFGPEWQTHFAA